MQRCPPSPAAALASKFINFIPLLSLTDHDIPHQRGAILRRFQALRARLTEEMELNDESSSSSSDDHTSFCVVVGAPAQPSQRFRPVSPASQSHAYLDLTGDDSDGASVVSDDLI